MGGYTALCCILFKWFVNKRMLLAQDICSSKSIATIVVKIFVVSTTYCTYFCVLSGFCLFFWKKGELACKLQIPLFNRHWEGSHICPFKHRLYCTTLLYLLVQYIKRQRLSRWNTFLKLKALFVILSFHILFNLNHTILTITMYQITEGIYMYLSRILHDQEPPFSQDPLLLIILWTRLN